MKSWWGKIPYWKKGASVGFLLLMGGYIFLYFWGVFAAYPRFYCSNTYLSASHECSFLEKLDNNFPYFVLSVVLSLWIIPIILSLSTFVGFLVGKYKHHNIAK